MNEVFSKLFCVLSSFCCANSISGKPCPAGVGCCPFYGGGSFFVLIILRMLSIVHHICQFFFKFTVGMAS